MASLSGLGDVTSGNQSWLTSAFGNPYGSSTTYGNPTAQYTTPGGTLGEIGLALGQAGAVSGAQSGSASMGLPSGLNQLGSIFTDIGALTNPVTVNFGKVGQTPTASGLYSGSPEVAGEPATGYNVFFGGIPGVPNPIASQQQATAANISELGGLDALTEGMTAINAGEGALPYQLNLPQYGAMTSQGSADILSNLQGQVSPSTVNQITQEAAERGIGAGLAAGSPNDNAALLSALGQTSEGLQSQGLQELAQAISQTPTGPAYDTTAMQLAPSDIESAQYAANVAQAAPVPAEQGAFQLNEMLELMEMQQQMEAEQPENQEEEGSTLSGAGILSGLGGGGGGGAGGIASLLSLI